uniref:Integrase_H2C2 domain-containing protein n=1 Tax=Syphacia muris TaxID=451379 RepID=A0A0N5A8G9_9BILA
MSTNKNKISSQIRSKRRISQFLGKRYDPFELVSPVLLLWNVVIQKLWEQNLDWYQVITQDVLFQYKETQLLRKWKPCDVILDRKASLRNERETIHPFTDASKAAFVVTAYGGVSNSNGKRIGQLLFAKSREFPLKSSLTIPKGELVAAWLGVEVLKFDIKELQLQDYSCYQWTDSKCVMNLPRSEANLKLPVFVRNCVDEVQATNSQFRYVPSEENPADLAKLINSKLWWEGPNWLTEEENHWPSPETQKECLSDMEQEPCLSITLCANTTMNLFDCSVKYRWNRMINIARHVESVAIKTKWFVINGSTTKASRKNAHLRSLERDCKKGNTGLISHPRSRWTLTNKRPVTTNRNGSSADIFAKGTLHSTNAFILDAHVKCGHLGTAATLTEFRTKFWIEHDPITVRRIINHECFKCRRERAKACHTSVIR